MTESCANVVTVMIYFVILRRVVYLLYLEVSEERTASVLKMFEIHCPSRLKQYVLTRRRNKASALHDVNT
jgi:hypothetical protein